MMMLPILLIQEVVRQTSSNTDDAVEIRGQSSLQGACIFIYIAMVLLGGTDTRVIYIQRSWQMAMNGQRGKVHKVWEEVEAEGEGEGKGKKAGVACKESIVLM